MRKVLWTMAILGVVVAPASAATLAYEGFDYSAGTLDGQGSAADAGWGAAWVSDPARDFVVVDSLSYTDVTTEGNKASDRYGVGGTRLLDTAASGAFDGYLDGSVIGANSTTLWMGVLVTDAGGSCRPLRIQRPDGPDADSDPDYAFEVWDSGATNGNWNLKIGEALTWQDSGVATGANQLLVLKIEFGLLDSDTVSLWVNPTVANGEAGLGAADAISSGADASFDRYRFAMGGNYASFTDETRVGTDFASVVPEPATLGLLVCGGLGLLIKRRRRIA